MRKYFGHSEFSDMRCTVVINDTKINSCLD